MQIRVAALSFLLALAIIPVALGDHETQTGPGACYEPDDPVYANATGHDVVCVDIVDVAPYEPAFLRIDPNTTVVWRNLDHQTHTVTVTAGDGPADFNHAVFPGNHSWTTFEEPGRYYYNCRVAFPGHAMWMHGSIIVKEPSDPVDPDIPARVK